VCGNGGWLKIRWELSNQSRVPYCLRRFNWEQMMKKAFGCVAVAITLVALTAPVQAKGCIKGAIVGGVAGHFAGNHGVLGAAAGCAIGHHEANKQQKTQSLKIF
jgi:outer membrane lipoprotein SlyB